MVVEYRDRDCEREGTRKDLAIWEAEEVVKGRLLDRSRKKVRKNECMCEGPTSERCVKDICHKHIFDKSYSTE